MKIPGFTAQASLYSANDSHHSSLVDRTSTKESIVVPQLGGSGYEGQKSCLIDCVERHPDWTAERCKLSCRDPGGTTPSSTVTLTPTLTAKADIDAIEAWYSQFGPIGTVSCTAPYWSVCKRIGHQYPWDYAIMWNNDDRTWTPIDTHLERLVPW